ncbi:MAG TPA: DUF2254 family protein [Kofleriaceae bacterium]|nr:DUF2254 family protein [Kofleriaceae bacterium]
MSSRPRRRPHRTGLGLWLVPMAILGGIALVVFASLYTLDHHVTGGISDPNPGSAAGRYVRFEPTLISDALSGLAGMTAAVLGIVLTVVSLLVQLTSERYTGVAQMFLRDRRNVIVMAYYVVTCVVGVALSLSLHNEFVPRAAVFTMMCACAFGLIMMLPYFAYVFRFLEPVNLIARIEREAATDVAAAAMIRDPELAVDGQAPALAALEELTDITSNSISGKDKIIASRAVDAIKDFVLGYLAVKGRADPRWFQIGDQIRDNPDFVAMDPESLRELELDRTWLEWKALRQYLGIYTEAQGEMSDINYLIAIDTRYVGEAALGRGDRAVVELAFRFMNTYLRFALNARAVRTAYNVMNQYRLLVESMIRGGADDVALGGVRHMIYYGRTSYDMQLGFVTETVAYDVSALCEFAHTQKSRTLEEEMLALFLELDQPLRLKRQEAGLQGIRKAQIKLACYYLADGIEDRAARIAADMAGEDRDRLRSIREQLARVESKKYWEIIDRGRNFDYMPPRQKDQMGRFFAMLDAMTPPAAAPVPPPPTA